MTKLEAVLASPEYLALVAEHDRLAGEYRRLAAHNFSQTRGMANIISRMVEVAASSRALVESRA